MHRWDEKRLQRLALKIVQCAALLVDQAGGLPRRVQRIALALDQGGDGGIGRGMLNAALAAAVLAVGGLHGLVQRRARCCPLRLNQLLGRILRCFQLGQIELARFRGLVSAGLLTLAKAVLRILFDLLEPLVAPGDVRLRAKQGLAPGFQKRPLVAQRRRLAHPRVQRFDAFLRISLRLALELACLLLGKFGLALRGSFLSGDLLALLLKSFFLFLRLFLDLAHGFGCFIGLLVQVQAQAAVLGANVAQRQFGRLQLAFGEFSRLHPGLERHDGSIGFVAPGPVLDLAPVTGNGVRGHLVGHAVDHHALQVLEIGLAAKHAADDLFDLAQRLPGGREGIVLGELAQVELVLLVGGIAGDALNNVAVIAL